MKRILFLLVVVTMVFASCKQNVDSSCDTTRRSDVKLTTAQSIIINQADSTTLRKAIVVDDYVLVLGNKRLNQPEILIVKHYDVIATSFLCVAIGLIVGFIIGIIIAD